jgi:hypothetical protein
MKPSQLVLLVVSVFSMLACIGLLLGWIRIPPGDDTSKVTQVPREFRLCMAGFRRYPYLSL